MSGGVQRVAEVNSDDSQAERGEVLAPAGVDAVVAAKDGHAAAVDIHEPGQLLAGIDAGGPEDVERDVVTVAAGSGVHGASDVVSGGLVVGDSGVDGLEGVVRTLDEFQLGDKRRGAGQWRRRGGCVQAEGGQRFAQPPVGARVAAVLGGGVTEAARQNESGCRSGCGGGFGIGRCGHGSSRYLDSASRSGRGTRRVDFWCWAWCGFGCSGQEH